MATLYVTQTHRGLVIAWTGTDLTGVLGNQLSLTFSSRTDNTSFTGAGTYSNPTVAVVGGETISTFTYTPTVSDVAPGNAGEWDVQVHVTYGDGTLDHSTVDVLELKPLGH